MFLARHQSLCVCEIVDTLELPQYQISKHLNILKKAGLVIWHKEGTWVYYSLIEEGLPFNQALFKVLKNHLQDPLFVEDEKKLEARLLLREGNRCVVGFSKTQVEREVAEEV